ncbi:MAG: DMT family transporter [Actinomycetota bacterium]
MEQTHERNRATISAFAVAVLIGGGNFIAVRFSNEELPPMFGASLRFGAAAILFQVIVLFARLPLPKGRVALGAALYGLLGFGIAYAFLYYALVELSAGMGSAIVASVPLATLVLAVLHRQEKFSPRGLVGGVLAIAGIAVLSIRALGGEIHALYFLSALVAALAIAESTVIIKSFPRTHPVTTNAVGMSVGAAFLVAASLAFREEWALPQRTSTWLALTWLVVFGSLFLFVLYLFVVRRWSASASNYVITLMPVVAVTLGVVIADESVTLELIVGTALVLAAVYIGALSPERPMASAGEPLEKPASS